MSWCGSHEPLDPSVRIRWFTTHPAAEAEIEIEVIKLAAVCDQCGEVECKLNDLKFTCKECGRQLMITAGREMRVDYIDLDDGE